MKNLLVVAAALVVGYVVYQKYFAAPSGIATAPGPVATGVSAGVVGVNAAMSGVRGTANIPRTVA